MIMKRTFLLAVFVLAPALAIADDASEGRKLAELNCARCHSIAVLGNSPFPAAPPFREVYKDFDESELQDAFMDGIPTRHPAMPDWDMTPDQARELAAFIMSLSPKP
jgi:cytochrome c